MQRITATNYLQRLGSKPGWYFCRAVPRDLVKQVGKHHWRWKAGDSLLEARRAALEGLLLTDRWIAEARGDVEGLTAVIDQLPRATTPLSLDLQQQGMSAQDISLPSK